MRGDLDVDGDLMSVLTLRTMFSERHPFQFVWRFVLPDLPRRAPGDLTYHLPRVGAVHHRAIREQQLPARVIFEHLLDHRTAEPYDAIVNLGVTEHLPYYRDTLAKYVELLKPGGRIYLDASASRVKHYQSAFLVKYLYPGNGSQLCLHEYLEEVARSPFRLLGVYDDRHSYHLTTKAWAEGLDRSRALVEGRWGPEVYRTFRLYLWGSAQALQDDLMQAYRWVLEKPAAA